MTLKIQGVTAVTKICEWLTAQQWPYEITMNYNNPFSQYYLLTVPDQQQRFLTQLRWGL